MVDRELHERLELLLRRVEALEARLQAVDDEAAIPTAELEAPAAPPQMTAAPVVDASSDIPGEVDEAAKPLTPVATNDPPAPASWWRRLRKDLTIERLVGGRLYALLGSLLVIVAVGTLLKLAWDAELFNLLPDHLKCVVAGLFGAAFVGAGEFARRRISPWASIGLTTTGLGVLYATSYAAWGFFHLVPPSVGFTLLAGTSALGIVVGTRAGQLSIAALSLTGGYLTPLMFRDVEAAPYTLPIYLGALLLVGLVVCARIGGRYALLRAISWWGSMVFGSFWLLQSPELAPVPHWVFIGAVWAAVHTELVFSAGRAQLSAGDASQHFMGDWRAIRPLASSITATAWAVAMALWSFRTSGGEAMGWAIPAAAAAALLAAAAWRVGLLGVLRSKPHTDLHRLAMIFTVEGGALILVAVAMAFADWAAVIAWTALGVAAVVAGEAMRSRAMTVYGIITQAIGGFNLVALEWWHVATGDGSSLAGLVVTRGTAVMAVTAAGWVATGLLVRRSSTPGSNWHGVAHALLGVGVTVSYLGFMNEHTNALQATWVCLALTATVLLVSVLVESRGLLRYAMVVAALAGTTILVLGKWFKAASIAEIADVVFTLWVWPMLALAALLFVCSRLASKLREDEWPVLTVMTTVAGMMVLMAVVVHEGSDAPSVVMVWLALAAAAFGVHRLQPRLGWSHVGLVVTMVTIVPLVVALVGNPWGTPPTLVALTPNMWLSLLVVGGIGAAACVERRLHADSKASRRLSSMAMGLALVLLFLTSSVEVGYLADAMIASRSGSRSAVSIWWGLFAIALLMVGFRRRIGALRYVGLSVLAIAAGKALVFDLASVASAWRAVSFLVLGVLMLGVGVAYARLMSRQSAQDGEAS